MNQLMTRKQLCEALQVNYRTVMRYEKKGMPVIKAPKSLPRYDYDQVIEWMKEKKS